MTIHLSSAAAVFYRFHAARFLRLSFLSCHIIYSGLAMNSVEYTPLMRPTTRGMNS